MDIEQSLLEKIREKNPGDRSSAELALLKKSKGWELTPKQRRQIENLIYSNTPEGKAKKAEAMERYLSDKQCITLTLPVEWQEPLQKILDVNEPVKGRHIKTLLENLIKGKIAIR